MKSHRNFKCRPIFAFELINLFAAIENMKCLEDSLRILWAHKSQRLFEVPLQTRPRAIVIAGPTGCGKSKLAMALALILGGEIISADSMQVYRGMDIGTAKPTLQQQQAVAHHLLDICDLDQIYNAARFVEDATKAIASAASRNRVPIICGGTGFYISSLIYGGPQAPPSDPAIRKQLLSQWDKFGADIAYTYLKSCDPAYAVKISKFDKHKIIRALEVLAITERPLSSFSPLNRRIESSAVDYRCFFLHRSRPTLYRRIEKRCEEMLQTGLLEEVSYLSDRGILENLTASQAIGYRQAIAYLKSKKEPSDFKHFVCEFKKATRHYAKRQFTWFRRASDFQWLDIEKLTEEIALEIIAGDYNAHFRG